MASGGSGNEDEHKSWQSPSEKVATTRLRRLQQLCSRTSGDSLPDALLFIGGVDGRFNAYSQAVLKYLFLGTTGRDLRNTEINLEHEALEDCILVVTRHCVHVLYSEPAAAVVLPVVAQWPQCTEYVLPDADGDDNDLFEEHKVRAFQRMVLTVAGRGSSIGIPFPRGFEDFRDIEMWPLVQSFAVDTDGDGCGIGDSRGFFSVFYQVQDAANALLKVFGSVDALAVEACVLRGSVSLGHHFSAMRRPLDKARCGAERLCVSEQDLVAPLQLLHDFGMMQDDEGVDEDGESARRDGSSGGRGAAAATSPLGLPVARVYPRVLLGTRTSDIWNQEARSSAKHTVGNTGKEAAGTRSSAEHFVVEAEEPSTGLCVCRTHFLATRGGTVMELIRAYRSLCVVLPAAASACSSTSGALKDMERRAAAATSATTLALNDADPKGEWTLEASVRAIDACRAAVVETGERDGGGYIMYVKLTMTGSRGTIAVGDSYAVVPSAGGAKERRNGQKHKTCLQMEEAATLLLTGPTCSAYLAVWGAAEGEEEEEAKRLSHALQDKSQLAGELGLGVPHIPEGGGPPEEAPATALIVDRVFSAIDGRLRLFSEGLSFRAPGCVPMVVSMRRATRYSVASVGIVDAPGTPGFLLLVVKFDTDSGRSNTPLAAAFPFLESADTFAIPLRNGSSLLSSVLKALNSWKEVGSGSRVGSLDASAIPAKMLAMLCEPPGVVGMTLSSTTAAERERAVKVLATDLSLVAARLNVAQLTAEYYGGRSVMDTGGAASSCSATDGVGGSSIRCKTIMKTTVLVGLPGSGVLSLAAAVLRFSSGEVDWTPVVFVSAQEGVDELELEKAIEEATAGVDVTAKTRVLVAVTAEVGAAAVCAGIYRWSAATRRLKIECYTACIRATDAAPGEGGDRRWRPFLMDQCAVGWASNVVITGNGATAANAWANARDLRRRLHYANTGLAFLAGCSAQYAGREALESILRDDVFESPCMLKARQNTLGLAWPSLRLPGTRKPHSFTVDGSTRRPSLGTGVATMESAPPEPSCQAGMLDPTPASSRGVDGRERTRAFRGFGTVDRRRLLAYLSALFPEAKVQPSGFKGALLFSSTEVTVGSNPLARSGADTGSSGASSGIKRAGELARAKVQEQRRREHEAQSLDNSVRRWRRERASSVAAHEDDPASRYPTSSVVGVVRTTDGEGAEVWTMVEATPDDICLSGLPVDASDESKAGSTLVAWGWEGEALDAVGQLLSAVCCPAALIPMEPKTRADLAAAELEALRDEHEADPLPDGWFFDGAVFVDHDGNRKRERPDMPQIIDNYLEAFNKEMMS